MGFRRCHAEHRGSCEAEKKRDYSKPRLRTIELVAEEVLGAGCKMVAAGSVYGDNPCYSEICFTTGS